MGFSVSIFHFGSSPVSSVEKNVNPSEIRNSFYTLTDETIFSVLLHIKTKNRHNNVPTKSQSETFHKVNELHINQAWLFFAHTSFATAFDLVSSKIRFFS